VAPARGRVVIGRCVDRVLEVDQPEPRPGQSKREVGIVAGERVVAGVPDQPETFGQPIEQLEHAED